MRKGKFITFEGVEGAGKSTQLGRLTSYLEEHGYEVISTREPGGTEGAEQIRDLLVNGDVNKWDGITETLLFFAGRRNHIEQLIKPALERGAIVICDRFTDSTIAYQHYGHGASMDMLNDIKKHAIGDFEPDLTFVLDLDIEEGMRRAREVEINRFEDMEMDFHRRVQKGFQEISKSNPERCEYITVDGLGIDDVLDKIKARTEKLLEGFEGSEPEDIRSMEE